MKTLLLSTVLGLTFVATSATAAVDTDQTSLWKRSHTAPVEVTENASEEQKTQIFRRIRILKVDVAKQEDAKQIFRRIRI